jgi:hypothetical protein
MASISPFPIRPLLQTGKLSLENHELNLNIGKRFIWKKMEEVGAFFYGELLNVQLNQIEVKNGFCKLDEFIRTKFIDRTELFNEFFNLTAKEVGLLGQVNLDDIKEKICNLSIERQKDLLIQASDKGLSGIVKIIINNTSFRENEYALAVFYAAKECFITELRELFDDKRIASLSINEGEYSLSRAMNAAIDCSQLGVLKILLSHPNSEEMGLK